MSHPAIPKQPAPTWRSGPHDVQAMQDALRVCVKSKGTLIVSAHVADARWLAERLDELRALGWCITTEEVIYTPLPCLYVVAQEVG